MDQTADLFIDLDGTLLDTRNRHYALYSHLITLYGGQPLPLREFWQLKREKIRTFILLQKSALADTFIEQYTKTFFSTIEDWEFLLHDKVFSDVPPTLDLLSQSYRLHLVTKRQNAENLTKQLAHLKINRFFTTVTSSHTKQKAELVQKHLKNPATSYMIGDTEEDIITGKTLNIPTVLSLYGIRSKEYLQPFAPDYFITTFSELPAILI